VSPLLSNRRGIGLVEVLIALFLISFGVLSLLSLQPTAWSLSGRSDYLGRAGGILHSQLETREMLLMNPTLPNPCIATNPLVQTLSVNASGMVATQPGDASFTVNTTILDNLNGTWLLTVRVTWPGNAAGLTESRLVTVSSFF
jgi:Tfp pilus assembly protein PilV